MRLKAMQFARIQQHRVARLLRVEALGTIQQNVLPLLRRHYHGHVCVPPTERYAPALRPLLPCALARPPATGGTVAAHNAFSFQKSQGRAT
jgi:hypothetical protein